MIDEQKLIRTVLAEQVKVVGYILSIVRSPEVAEDVFQDVCALAVEKRSEIVDEAHLRNWLRTTAKLLTRNLIRKRKENHLLLAPEVLEAVEQSWTDLEQLDGTTYGDALRKCVAKLSEPHQQLLNKRFVEQYEYEQLAVESNRPVKSLYVTFSRIYSFLGKCITEKMAAVEMHHG